MSYASNYSQSRKRPSASPNPGRSKSKVDNSSESKSPGATVKRNRAQSRLQKAGHEAILTGRCWLCNGARADTQVTVARETPAGKPCKPKLVVVHFGCWMDMDD